MKTKNWEKKDIEGNEGRRIPFWGKEFVLKADWGSIVIPGGLYARSLRNILHGWNSSEEQVLEYREITLALKTGLLEQSRRIVMSSENILINFKHLFFSHCQLKWLDTENALVTFQL